MVDEITAMFAQLFSLGKTLGKENYDFLKKNPRYLFLLPILVIAVFLRFHTIASAGPLPIHPEDIRIAHTHLDGTITLLGGKIWPGDFALGPFYNYLFEPTFVFGSFDPIGPAYLAGFLFVLTVLLVYLTGKQFFNVQAGLFASALYSVAPQIFSYSNKSWNSDILPFFTLLFIYVLFCAAASARSFLYYIIAGFLLGICVQLHYSAVVLVIVAVLYVVIIEFKVRTTSLFKQLSRNFLALVLGFLICLLPFFYYEALHHFVNMQHITVYLIHSAQLLGISKYVFSLPYNLFMLFARVVINYPTADAAANFTSLQLLWLGVFGTLLGLSGLFAFIFTRNRFITLLVGLWLIFGILMFTVVQRDIVSFQFSLLYPVFVLLIGNVFAGFYHLMEQERVKMAKQLLSSTGESETYTMIPIDVTDKNKLLAHRLCVFLSILIFLLVCLLNII